MVISGSLVTAHEHLLHVIPKPLTAEEEAERVRTGGRLPEVDPAALHDAALRFVEALSADPAAAAELKRRGTLCAILTAEGREYSVAAKKAQKALADWNLAGQFAASPVHLKFLNGKVRNLLAAASRELVAEVREKYGRMNDLLAIQELPQTTRTLLEAWRDAARSIVSKGENDSLDGCYWLLHTDVLQHALIVPATAPEVRQAADALVRWLAERGESDGARTDESDRGGPTAWVPANHLWNEKFSSYKELTKFRLQHPEMFRHPSKFKLEIHAGLWASYWAERDKVGFEQLGEQPSIADDPNVAPEFLKGAAERMEALRAKKKTGKQET